MSTVDIPVISGAQSSNGVVQTENDWKRERMSRILVDMDGVVADLTTTWLQRLGCHTGYFLSPADVHQYNLMPLLPDDGIREVAAALIRDGSMFSDLRPYPGAVSAVLALAGAGHDIRFTTMALNGAVAGAKVAWIEQHFPGWGAEQVILTHDKDWLRADIAIDDAPRFLKSYASSDHRPHIIGVPHPYNADAAELCDLWAAPGVTDMSATWALITDYITQEFPT